ncbi:hypothetical protein ACJMK2_026084 [Sinanodonta woodiana]|uniref:Uncharacterized protein n=1 Tax=Sinanodonta woodiana TaxID=1069815 RepID=A0ABD3XKA1_SINWO
MKKYGNLSNDKKGVDRRSQKASVPSIQYSRKLNRDMLGLDQDENKHLVSEVTKINLNNRDIVAVHRIRGHQGQPWAVIVKLWSLDCNRAIIKCGRTFQTEQCN